MAKTVSFDLNIDGNDVALHKSLELSDVGEGKTKIIFDFADKNGTFKLVFYPAMGQTEPAR